MPRAASIIQVVGIAWEIGWRIRGIDSTGKMYPERNTHGSTLPITFCMASSREFELAEINRPMPRAERTKGKLIARRVKNKAVDRHAEEDPHEEPRW